MNAQCSRISDGRLHLHHGPIDIIARAWGPPSAVAKAEAAAFARFETILTELVADLPLLRRPADQLSPDRLKGAIAQQMALAVAPFSPAFITPMAAVAGAVAEAVLAAFAQPGITKAYVNNGGDIALHLTGDEMFSCAIATAAQRPGRAGQLVIHARDGVRGIATSGWRGRSFSLGIADAVTVLAKSAAAADAAATMIANAVDLPGHPAIHRQAANALQSDSDLGPRLVTVAVGPLCAEETSQALDAGLARALQYRQSGLIESAALFLQPQVRLMGHIAMKEPEFA